jgi:diguanylate cyclase (GGDEF)-like protein
MNKQLVILIIDENPEQIQELTELFQEQNYDLTLANNGEQALEIIESNPPDLIVMERVLADIDGITLCKQIKQMELSKEIPILFVSAISKIQDKLQAFEAGCVDYVTKPFIPQELLARINVHIEILHGLKLLENRAVTDELTGLFNRRFAYETLAKNIEISKRNQQGFVVCFIDIDNLKTINDTYGHAEGDVLIKTAVESFKKVVRLSDYLFRIGGDEFLFVLPKAKIENSHKLIKRLRTELNHKKIHGIPIDFSYGFSEYHPNDNLSPEELIKIADFRMYQIKIRKKAAKNG